MLYDVLNLLLQIYTSELNKDCIINPKNIFIIYEINSKQLHC